MRLRLTFFSLILLALAARVPAATANFVIGTDEAAYLTLAQNLAAGHGFTLDGLHPHTEFDPGYPLVASAIYWLTDISNNVLNKNTQDLSTCHPTPLRFGDYSLPPATCLELPAKINLLLGGLVVIPVYLLTRQMYGEAVARRAGLLTALLPALTLSVPNFGASSEQVYTLCLWLGLLALWAGLRETRWRAWGFFALAGLAFGYAHLTRWEGAIYLLIGIGWIGWVIWQSPGARLGVAGKLLIFILAFGLVAVPYGIYLENAQGTWFSSKATTQQLQGEAVANADPLAWEREYAAYEQARTEPQAAAKWIESLWINRDAEINLYFRNWLLQLMLPFRSSSFLAIVWLPFGILAWLKRWREPGEVQRRVYLGSALVPLTFFPIAFVDARYLLPLTPVGLIWAAEGLTIAEEGLRTRVARLPSYSLTGFICLTFAAASVIGPFLIPQPTEYKALGEWMQTNNIANGETVLARKRQVPFYAGAQWEWLPLADLDGVLVYAQAHHARYLVIDERTVPTLRPELAFLLDPAQAPATLRVVHVIEGAEKIVLYQIMEINKGTP